MQRTRTMAQGTVLAAALLAAAPAAAQTITGRVVDPVSGEAVPGAMVLMRGEDGSERRALADMAGNYSIRAREAGSYILFAERVGYQSAPSAPIRVGAGETVRHELRAGSGRVMLAAITATARSRACDGNVRRGPEAQVLWEEARKVVAASTLSGENQQVQFVTRLHRHQERLDERRPSRQTEWTITTSGKPFIVQSAQDLVRRGYVEFGRDSTVFHGIDAQAILSDEFVRHHCFSVREGGTQRPGQVGLEFMPLRGSMRVDVQGVLWLDRASAELRVVEYRFTGLRYSGPVERLGGRMSFEKLEDGAWIVRDWIVDAPILEERAATPASGSVAARPRVRGIVRTGGEVTEVRMPGREPVRFAPGTGDAAKASP